MLLWVMEVEFENTYTVSGKSNASRIIPILYGWVYKTLRLINQDHPRWGSQFSIPVLWNLYPESEVSGSIIFSDQEDSDSGYKFQHVSTGYFYILFLWAIVVSDFRHLKIYKNLGFLLSVITLSVSSHGDNHFHKYIYLFQYSTVSNYHLSIKTHVEVLYIEIWFKYETPLLFFLIRTMVTGILFFLITIVYRKKNSL